MLDEKTLARFIDRHTMVYDRVYPHDIDLVWEAVSTGEHLDVWMLPESRVERRLGGACAFGWGGSADDPAASRGEVTVFEPPKVIQYSFDGGSYMRFDLNAVDESTMLRFTLHFLPADGDSDRDELHDDLPAGRGTAWRPGFLAGYHEMLDNLSPYLLGDWTAADTAADIAGHLSGEWSEGWLELSNVYRDHIRDHCPPA